MWTKANLYDTKSPTKSHHDYWFRAISEQIFSNDLTTCVVRIDVGVGICTTDRKVALVLQRRFEVISKATSWIAWAFTSHIVCMCKYMCIFGKDVSRTCIQRQTQNMYPKLVQILQMAILKKSTFLKKNLAVLVVTLWWGTCIYSTQYTCIYTWIKCQT